uniref:Uncharacterized protein n=1 Tax=Oryza nivara TaxID=4536 RepID=A0A0E0GGP6_ORYNI
MPSAAGRREEGRRARKKAVTRSVKAGLQFPVGRIGRYLKKSRPVDLLSAAPSPSAAPTLFPTASVTPPTLFPTASVTPPTLFPTHAPQDIPLYPSSADMARKEGEGLDLVAMEEELDLYSWEPVVTLAISLLDRAISYLGEDSSWAEGRNKNRFGGFSSQMFYYLQPARGRFQDFLLRLINWPKSYCCGYEEIWKFRIAVELLEDLIEEIEHRRLEEDGRIPSLFMNAKAKIAFKFATNDYFREEWDRLFQEFTTFRLEDLITDIEHLRLEESGKKISNKKFARSPDQYKQQARLFFLLERGVSRLRDQLPAVVEHVVSQDRELVDLEKELHAELVGRDREKKQIVQWLVEQPAENSEIIFPFKKKKTLR